MKVEHYLVISQSSDSYFYIKEYDKSIFENISVGQNILIDLINDSPNLKISSIQREIYQEICKISYWINCTESLNENVLFILGFERCKKK